MNDLEKGIIGKKIEKPPVLYHASHDRNREYFTPQKKSFRDKDEDPAVFASPNFAISTLFLVRDVPTECGAFGEVVYMVIPNREKFIEQDKGGAVYSLPSDTFNTNLDKGLGDLEWTSKEEVRPIAKQEFESGLQAMIENNVQVYFVDEETFKTIRNSPDHGLSILKTLKSENQLLNKNVVEFK